MRSRGLGLQSEIKISKAEIIRGYRLIRKSELEERMEAVHKEIRSDTYYRYHGILSSTPAWLLLWEDDYVFTNTTNANEKNGELIVDGTHPFVIAPKPVAKIPQSNIWYIQVRVGKAQVVANQALPEKKKIILSERIQGNSKMFKCPEGYRKMQRIELKGRESEARDLVQSQLDTTIYQCIGIWDDDQVFTNAPMRVKKRVKMTPFILRTKYRDKISRFFLIEKNPVVIQKSLPRMKLSFFETHEFIRDLLFDIFEGNVTHVILSFIHFSTGTYTNNIFGTLKVYLNFETKKWALYDNMGKNLTNRSMKKWGTFTLPKQGQREYCKTPEGLQSSIKLELKELGHKDGTYNYSYLSPTITLRWIPSYGLQYSNQSSGYHRRIEYKFLTFHEFACTLNFDFAKKMEANEREFSAIDWIMDVASEIP